MTDFPRLIEFAFPLKQTSLDSVREKYGPRGHISGFHLWPARRPLAASRASLIATMLPDPGDSEKRRKLCEKIAGKVVKKIERKKMPSGQVVERVKEDTDGGILQWKRETENSDTLEWFRQEIRKAYGGRAPKVIDPFAGGGAIPFEAMRLGCEVTAIDINPVAWFILKCTLEYPQKLAGQTFPLPAFILHDEEFMRAFFEKAKLYSKAEAAAALERLADRGKTKPTKRRSRSKQQSLPFVAAADDELKADLSWHVRAWGRSVFNRARQHLAQHYPTYASFEPLKKDHIAYEMQPMQLLSLKDCGTADIDALNATFTEGYLADKRNPRWLAKPTVAYLWARTVVCKNCRATVPLLKTRWLCRKDKKRVLLTMAPNDAKTGVVFGIEERVPSQGGNAAQRREYDKRIGAGTMSRSGARCPCCNLPSMTMEDIRLEGRAGRLFAILTAVVVDGQVGKEYRLPTDVERRAAESAVEALPSLFSAVPFGVPNEPTASKDALGFRAPLYGLDQWSKLFTPRQLLALGRLVLAIRESNELLVTSGYPNDWVVAVRAYLSASLDRLVDQSTTLATWYLPGENVKHTYVRYALPITWDFAEANPMFDGGGSWSSAIVNCCAALDHALRSINIAPSPKVLKGSSTKLRLDETIDIIVTDPPYYDAIPYSDLMDLFYVWLRRSLSGAAPEFEFLNTEPISPKWDVGAADGELIDDASRHNGDATSSKQAYEEGMFRAFQNCFRCLADTGRLVVVFAHKQPDAWATLVSALIRAGFVVDASWPIQTENATRSRARGSAALASSLWLVCKKRSPTARSGWDNTVLQEMRANIAGKLREFWDAGIRGPDFVWAATGPALEAYSKHPVVRKANEANATMGVGEFLTHVRRMVVDYIVGQVLSGERGADLSAADRLDEVTAYYLLHRHDFGMDDAPVGACILYATACELSDAELDKTWDVLVASGKNADEENAEDEDSEGEDAEADDTEGDTSGGSKVKLKPWNQRRGKSLGHDAPQGKAVPLIDRIHRVMHLWKDGDLHKVDEYLDQHALRRHELFKRVVQSLIELSTNSERSLLESISNHIGAKGAKPAETMPLPGMASIAEREDE